MKLLSFSAILVIVFFLLVACRNSQEPRPAENNSEMAQGGKFKDGKHPVYNENGKLKYMVEYKDGKANGQVKQFYEDGKLYMEATFTEGRRNGKCTYFYKNGKAHSVSIYVNGTREGDEIKYWESGELLSVCPFKNDKVQTGLKEYRKDGTLIGNNISILINTVESKASDGKRFLKVSLSNPETDASYYVSDLSEKAPRVKLAKSGYAALYEIKAPKGATLKKQLVFDAEYKTSLGNTMRLQKSFNLIAN